MKTIQLFLALVLACATPIAHTGCSTPPDSRVVQVQTLKAVGASAKAGMDASTQLLKDGRISVEQWKQVAAFYDGRFQPAFNLAVAAARSDLSSISSPDLVDLAAKFAALVAQLTQSTP